MTTQLLNQAVYMDDLSADEEYITAAQFEDATRTVVRTLGKNHALDIVYAGNGGKTDGSTVTLPAQDPTKLMTRKQYAAAQGYANHETLHNLCSDMPFMTKELERLKKQGKKLAMTCANAVEDVRIEAEGRRLYPGMPTQIDATADLVAKEFYTKYYENDKTIVEDFKRIGPLAITWRGRERLGYGSPYIKKCLDTLSPEMLAQVDKWCDLVEKLPHGATGPGEFDQDTSKRGCHKAFEVAELIAREIEEVEQEPEDEDDQDQQGQGGGQGQGQGNQHSQGNANSAGGGSAGAKHAAGGKGTEPEPLDVDMGSSVSNLLNQGDVSGWRPVTTAMDSWVTRDTKMNSSMHRYRSTNALADKGNITTYNSVVSEIGGRTAVMKRKFERALLTKAEAEYVTGQRSGRLDIRGKGTAIMQGRENIFRKKQEGEMIDTAVSILVDVSGSMAGTEIELATKVCIAMTECLEHTTVDLEVLAFTSDYPWGIVTDEQIEKFEGIISAVQKDQSLRGRFHRCGPIKMYELKSFDDSLREAKQSLGAMPRLASGGTPLPDAMLKAATRLMNNKKPKKIMLVLTDGRPEYAAMSGNIMEYSKMVQAYCTKIGIATIGVGIRDTTVKSIFKNWSVINDLDDLDKAVMSNIAKMVLGENFKIDNADVSGAAINYQKRSA